MGLISCQQSWAASPPSAEAPVTAIKVVMDDSYPPYAFRDHEGRLQGILIDQWRLWEEKTGVRTEIQGMAWYLAQSRMQAGEFDVIDTIFFNERRAQIYDFSRPYATLDVPIFFHRDLSGITDAASLKGFSVAVKSGDAAIDFLKRNGVTQLDRYPSYESVVEAITNRRVSVFVMDKPPALYFLYRSGLQDEFRISAPLYSGEFHRAVKKGRTELLRFVEEGFGRITPAEDRAIERRWQGERPFQPRYLAYVGTGLGVALALVLGLVAWNRLLRRAVREKTARLEDEITISRQREQAYRESEEKFRLFIEHFPGLIFIKNVRLQTVMLSKLYETLLGRPLAEMIGKTNDDLFPEVAARMNEDDRKALDLPYGRHLELEESYRGRSYLTYKFPVALQSEKMVGGFTIDITERKLAEAERRKLETQIQHTQKLESLGILAGGIAHDFNNILMAILGNIDLAQADLAEGSPAQTRLTAAAKAAQRAADLCRQMLAYAGKGRFMVETVDVNRLLREMVEMIEVSISKNAALQWNLAPALPAVRVDPTQMRQIVMNLVINASESIGPRQGVVGIATGVRHCLPADLEGPWLHQSLSEGDYVILEISDTGSGMAPETLPKIFDPFFSTKFTGRGLGLAAVLGIVRSHRGAIQVESQPGRGTIFRVFLAALPDAVAEPPRPENVFGADWRGVGTVLLVDDEESVRLAVQPMLERMGFNVLTAAHGMEAIEVFQVKRNEIVCVLLDLTMPHLDGEATLKALRQLGSNVPVVLSSGYDEHDVIGRFAGQGLAGFIQKPYTQKNLVQVLKQATTAKATRPAAQVPG